MMVTVRWKQIAPGLPGSRASGLPSSLVRRCYAATGVVIADLHEDKSWEACCPVLSA